MSRLGSPERHSEIVGPAQLGDRAAREHQCEERGAPDEAAHDAVPRPQIVPPARAEPLADFVTA
jgi:hypothetical protein